MKINSIISVRCNNIQQKHPATQEPILTSQTDDKFVKQPSFRGISKLGYFLKVYSDAINNNDVHTLKKMIEEKNWQFFPSFGVNNFKYDVRPLLEQGLKSKNPEIKALFNDKNLCNLFSQYRYSTSFPTTSGMFDFAKIYYNNTQDKDKRKVIAEEMVQDILLTEFLDGHKIRLRNIFNPAHKKLSIFPMTDYERFLLRKKNKRLYPKELYESTMKARLKSIISRNGIDTPEKLLNCLNDKIMSPEILEMKYKDKELIYRISDILVNDENKETVSKIAAKLAEMKLPDNETFQTAGVRAAYGGNEAVLKAFNLTGVHYMNKIIEPISNFPQNVHDVLNNAKINDSNLTSYVCYPEVIENYLETHPNVDINSRDTDGDTLVLKAVKERDLDTLEMLAKRDDVDWNAVDKDQKNILIQMLNLKVYNSELKPEYSTEFAKKLLKLLRELPEGKFDINYANYFSFDKTYGCFFTLSDFKDDVLAFPDFNPMMKIVNDGYSNLVERCSISEDLLKKIAAHPNCDPDSVTMIGPKLVLTRDFNSDPDMQFAKQMNDIYDKNGYLDLDEIEMYIDYPSRETIHHKFNVAEENIAHLLVDISPDTNNPTEIKKYKKLFEKLHKAKFFFGARDIFGRTPLDKAIECENEVAFNILVDYT